MQWPTPSSIRQILSKRWEGNHSALGSKSEFRWNPATAGPVRRGVRLGASRGSSRLRFGAYLDSHLRNRFIFGLLAGSIRDLLLQEETTSPSLMLSRRLRT